MQKYTFRQFIIDVLEDSSRPLTFMEIWESEIKWALKSKGWSNFEILNRFKPLCNNSKN